MSDTLPSNSGFFQEINDGLDSANQTLGKVNEFLDKSKELLEKVGTVVTAVKALVAIADLLGLFGEKSELQSVINQLRTLIAGVMNKIDAASYLSTDQQIGENRAAVEHVLNEINHYLKSDKTEDDWETFMQPLEQTSSGAVTGLMEGSVWTRTFSENTLTTIKWAFPYYWPPRSGGLVWDYRMAMPALMHAISVRMLYITAKPEHNDFGDEANRDELNTYADFLLKKYNTILSGIVETPAPTPMEFRSFDPLGDSPLSFGTSGVFSGSWNEAYKRPCGAVDIYTGSSWIQRFELRQPVTYLKWKDEDSFNKDYNSQMMKSNTGPKTFAAHVAAVDKANQQEKEYAQKFYLAYSLRTKRAAGAAFGSIGLQGLWDFIGNLKKMIGEPWEEQPPHRGYSLANGIITGVKRWSETNHTGDVVPSGAVSLFGGHSVRRAAERIGPALSAKGGALQGAFSTLTGGSPTVSLRAMLAGTD